MFKLIILQDHSNKSVLFMRFNHEILIYIVTTSYYAHVFNIEPFNVDYTWNGIINIIFADRFQQHQLLMIEFVFEYPIMFNSCYSSINLINVYRQQPPLKRTKNKKFS